MELSTLNGNIIGVISNNYKEDDFKDLLVKDIIVNKTKESLKMVKLDETILDKKFSDLSSNYQNKVIIKIRLKINFLLNIFPPSAVFALAERG